MTEVVGPKLWEHPEPASTRMFEFKTLIETKYNVQLPAYRDLHEWTKNQLDNFWEEVWHFTGIKASTPFSKVGSALKLPSSLFCCLCRNCGVSLCSICIFNIFFLTCHERKYRSVKTGWMSRPLPVAELQRATYLSWVYLQILHIGITLVSSGMRGVAIKFGYESLGQLRPQAAAVFGGFTTVCNTLLRERIYVCQHELKVHRPSLKMLPSSHVRRSFRVRN